MNLADTLRAEGISEKKIARIIAARDQAQTIDVQAEVVREEPVALSAGEIATRDTPMTRPASERSETCGPSIHSTQSSQYSDEQGNEGEKEPGQGRAAQASDNPDPEWSGDKVISLPDQPSGAPARAQPMRPWMTTFIEEFAKFGIIGDGCREAKVSWDTVNKYREQDPAFKAAYEAALREAVDKVERRGMEIAGEGTQRAIYHQGIVVGYETVYDTGMIQFMLKKRRQDQYADKLDVNVTSQHLHLHVNPEQIAARAAMLAPSLVARAALYLPGKKDEGESQK